MNWPLNNARMGTVSIVVGLVYFLMGGFLPAHAAAAAEPTAAAAAGGKRFATVFRIRGELTASGGGSERKLREGDVVHVGEKVRAPALAEAVLKTDDAGMVAVRPGTEFVAERFAAEDKPTDSFSVRLFTGSLRVISGWISRTNRSGHNIVTPSATIGIRGTDHEPYVLPASMANSTYRQGTYDKVNRGETLLDANGGNVAIDSGKVGFARDPSTAGTRTRALMTILLPVLLTKVPEFYVAGSFDQELDRYSESIDAVSQKQLQNRPSGPRPAAQASSAGAEPAPVSIVGCPPKAIGEAWLNRFDRAIVRRDVKTILSLFAPEIVANATVMSGNETKTLEFGRDEMVSSTLSSIASLKNYSQRRVSLEASLAAGETEATCKQIVVQSIAIEQGLMNDKPYRFEALEEYLLEQRNGEWLAIRAQTTQR